jgi:DNA-binding MarR family transcriptional regulator
MAASGRKPRTGATVQQAMVRLLTVAGRVQQELNDICAVEGITHDQYNVLRILRGAQPDGHPRYEIAERMMSRAPDVTRLLDRLERAGFIERVRSGEDRRLSVSRITRSGLALLDTLDPEVHALHARITRRLTADEQRELGRLCSTMLE